MMIKTSEATPRQLDWLVAQIEGWQPYMYRINASEPPIYTIMAKGAIFYPAFSTDPSLAWPIIDREGIAIWLSATPEKGKWASADARWMDLDPNSDEFLDMPDPWHGPTSLIAAMRCFVASRLGDEVEVPDELA